MKTMFEVWESNRTRCNGHFNLYFFWMYPFLLPFCLTWDFLMFLERRLS